VLDVRLPPQQGQGLSGQPPGVIEVVAMISLPGFAEKVTAGQLADTRRLGKTFGQSQQVLVSPQLTVSERQTVGQGFVFRRQCQTHLEPPNRRLPVFPVVGRPGDQADEVQFPVGFDVCGHSFRQPLERHEFPPAMVIDQASALQAVAQPLACRDGKAFPGVLEQRFEAHRGQLPKSLFQDGFGIDAGTTEQPTVEAEGGFHIAGVAVGQGQGQGLQPAGMVAVEQWRVSPGQADQPRPVLPPDGGGDAVFRRFGVLPVLPAP